MNLYNLFNKNKLTLAEKKTECNVKDSINLAQRIFLLTVITLLFGQRILFKFIVKNGGRAKRPKITAMLGCISMLMATFN